MKLKVKIFADGADINEINRLSKKKFIKGFTTNPTLLEKNGVTNYKNFIKKVTQKFPKYPFSFEVVADDVDEIIKQAEKISNLAKNINVKIPITNTKSEYMGEVISYLSNKNIKLNITAITTFKQVKYAATYLKGSGHFISIFAGRIADTGRDPKPIIIKSLKLLKNKKIDIIWASPRELYNIIEASKIGCNVITVTPDILNKFDLINKNLDEYSLDTVKMFFNSAKKAKLSL